MSAPGTEWISDRSRENTPPQREAPEDDGPSHQRTSKKRKVLSCYACRNRKMKCDRVFPVCGRCQKTGRRHECTYDPRLLEESQVNVGTHADMGAPYVLVARPTDSSPSVDTSDASRWKTAAQERHTGSLEQQLAQQRTKRVSRFNEIVSEEPVIAEEMLLRGKGFKTRFHGMTSVMSIVSTYHELQAFTNEALSVDHDAVRIKDDFKAFHNRSKSAKEGSTGRHGSDTNLFALLPEKSIIDAQAALYFRMCETSYRILHEPSFWKYYSVFWEKDGTDKERVVFAVMLLLIVAIAKCFNPKDDVFVGDTTADRQAAHDLIDVCEDWINTQPQRRITLPFFQTQCLLLLAKRINSIGVKQNWLASGSLLRLALASGLHRDPNLQGHGAISLFDQQIKKRLWATVMELELQASIDDGLQSGLTALYFDTPAPAHIADEALSTDMQQLPAEQPDGQFTSTSYLIESLKSLPFRVHLAHQLNTPSSNIQYTDVLHLDAQIHAAISNLPEWNDENAAVPSALLRLQLSQYLLILHRPFVKLAAKNSRCMYSLTTCVDVCDSMVAIHDDLLSKGILILNHLRHDIIRVGLTLSQAVFHNCTLRPIKSSVAPHGSFDTQHADPKVNSPGHKITKNRTSLNGTLYLATIPQNSFVAKTLCVSSIEILERARQIFNQKVFRLGCGYMEYWMMSAAASILPASPSPNTPITYANNVSDDILSRCKRAIACFVTLASRLVAQRDPESSLALSIRTTMSNALRFGDRAQGMGFSSLDTGNGPGMTPETYGHSNFAQTNDVDTDLLSGNASINSASPFNMLQDMQIDSNSWSFPDFWAFDLDGDF